MMTAEAASDSPACSDMINDCLDHLVQTMAGRPEADDAARIAKASVTKTLILAMDPKSGLELALASSAVLFLSLAAITGADLMTQAHSPGTARMRSAVVAMGRIAGKNMDTLARLQKPPSRQTKAAARPVAAPAAEPKPAEDPASPAPAEVEAAFESPKPPQNRAMRRRAEKLVQRAMRAAGLPPPPRSRDIPALHPTVTSRG